MTHFHPLCDCHNEPRVVDEAVYSLWGCLVELFGQPHGGVLVNCGTDIHLHPHVDSRCGHGQMEMEFVT